MSRLTRKPLIIPENVEVREENGTVHVKGPKGELQVTALPRIEVVITDAGVEISRDGGGKQAQANLGTTAALIRNALQGVHEGYQKDLVMKGVGYNAKVEGDALVLEVGLSHSVRYQIPEGVDVSAQKTNITVSGTDKELVGQVAAKIRSFRKPEPYQGSGIRYQDEVIRRKVGKKAATGGVA